MKFGLQISPYVLGLTGNPWDSVATIARYIDESAFDSLWLYDHFLYEGGFSAHPFSEPIMECFTTLGAVAAITQRVRLGQLVLGVPYRNPAMMTKMATTLDLLSHGRSILGLGASWHQREYEGYGWGKFESTSIRLKRLEEAIQVVLALWTENPAHFKGTYYQLNQVLDNPPPLQQPHPPILIGGSGKKTTLRLVAQYGDFCNVTGNPHTVEHLFNILRIHCDQVMRSYDEVTRSIYTTVVIGKDESDIAYKYQRYNRFIPLEEGSSIVGTPQKLITILEKYKRIGCQYTILRMPDWSDIESVGLFAEHVIPALID